MTVIRKFEFSTKQEAQAFIDAHREDESRQDFIGPFRLPLNTPDGTVNWSPLEWSKWMVDTDNLDPLPEWARKEVFPSKAMHNIIGRKLDYVKAV